MASKKLSSDTSLANSYKLSRGLASVARPSAPTIGTATDGGSGNMSVTFTASTLGPTASSFTLTSSSGVTGSGASSPLTLQETAVGTYTYSVSGVNANGTGPSSAASNSVNVASVFTPSGSYDSIATATVSNGTTTTLTFASIPSTYTHLQLRYIIRTDRGDDFQDAIGMRFNSDTGTNYYRHRLETENTGAVVAGANSGTDAQYHFMGASALCAANVFASGVVDIVDYASTSKNKTTRSLSGVMDSATKNWMGVESSVWLSTSAINRIDLKPNYGLYYAVGSTIALYGIKGS
jgi:hypothetical protein